METVTTSRIIAEFFIKLIVLFKRPDLNERLGLHLIDVLMSNNGSIKSQQDLYFGKQFNKYMVFLSIIVNSDLKIKQLIINDILKRINSSESKLPQYIGYLHLITICLLKEEVIKKVKPVIF